MLNDVSTFVVIVHQSQTCIRENVLEPLAFLQELSAPLKMNKLCTSLGPNGNSTKISQSLSFERGFHFYTASRKYTGITATSLSEFSEKLQLVGAQSAKYHFCCRDFQGWINDTIGDSDLAAQLAQLDAQLPSENLRKDLLKIVQRRLREVEKLYASSR